MSKSKIYTILVCCLSVTVVCGGWFLTKEMIRTKETEVLATKGQIEMEGDLPQIEEDFKEEIISEEIMAKILFVWGNGGSERFHEPMPGQMNMEQAIETGRGWIDMMVENHIFPTELYEGEFENLNAVLCSIDSQVSLEDELISYWKVTFKEDDIEIILRIHAISGQVWQADVSMKEERMELEMCTDEKILATAFPFFQGGDTDMTIVDDKMIQVSPRGKVYASLKRYSLAINNQEPIARFLFNLSTEID